MRVIFLDIDGVLNTLTTNEFATINPHKVALLNEIVLRTDAEIVISSTWRRIYSLNEIGNMLTRAGLIRFPYGITPMIEGHESCRGMEIGAWINANQSVEQIVILDDDRDLDPLLDYLVQTDPWTGLTPQKVEEAIAVLMSKTP